MSTSILEPLELQRYQRQMLLPELGLAGQEKLKQACVLVVGAGGLGCPVLSYLAAAGVGRIKIADGDLVERSNLHRQPLYGNSAIGCAKAERAALTLGDSNPHVTVVPLACRVEAANVGEMIADVDIVIDGSDNFSTKYLLNDACVVLGKPLVSGSIFCFEGQVSVFNALKTDASRGPTYRCLFPEPPPAELVPSCAEAGVLGVLPGVVGTLQATETLKLILGIGDILAGRLLLFDALGMSFSEISFERNEEEVSRTHIRAPSYYRELSSVCGSEVAQISASELKGKLERSEDFLLIDVREPFEKNEFDLGGELIPSARLLANAERIPRDRTVVLYCHSGIRSARGIRELSRKFGFTNLLNLKGGIVAWQSEIGGDGGR